jgi:hypothetical protein
VPEDYFILSVVNVPSHFYTVMGHSSIRKQHSLRVSENGVLRRIFGLKKDYNDRRMVKTAL